jgi:DnaK suppressor protein
MTVEEIKELETLIERKIRSTEEAIAEYKDMTRPVSPDASIGRISRIDAMQNNSVIESALREAEGKLQRLKLAKVNLHGKDFGYCNKCHAPIPFNRIKAMPDTARCIKCA